MIYGEKTNPVGVDYFVGMMQHLEQEQLPSLFGVSEALCLFYGRAEVLTMDEKPVKVVFVSGIDYKPLEYDGAYAFKSYLMLGGSFEQSTTQEYQYSPSSGVLGNEERVEASLYCHGDLKQLFPSITHRADEEMRLVMKDFVKRLIEPQNLKSIEIIEDMQPYHSFKINFTIT